ncbi:thioredoxin [Ochrobactrum sp. Marseille-Q0166]|uniref:thioredoxin n=1 Tax=Ochrobactrum sp. Marseille-Q0166 TaxID=2761105 RepID=UPI00165633D2|nr:thioredoxin [Ochrobactrum sp. Marseille-Q0166]MBC8719566.1 thioredoxin [Ochrobactrum sp. Marseille-Q0166]
MAEKAVFYHAGCAVCTDAEERFVGALDRSRFAVETVHLGEAADRIAEARTAGVKSVPALVIGNAVYHINHGADLSALG